MGYNAGYQTRSGNSNTFVGTFAGNTNQTGINNTLIGYGTDISVNNLDNAAAIGYLAVAYADNSMSFGNGSCTDWHFGRTVANTAGRALQVGQNSTDGNNAYLTEGGV